VWSILPVRRLTTITTLEAIPCSRWHGLLTLHEHPTWWVYVSQQCGEGRSAPCQSLDLLAILDLRSTPKVLLSIGFSLAVMGLHLACGGLELVSNCVAFCTSLSAETPCRISYEVCWSCELCSLAGII
jgi:hypothetical protein